MQRRLEQQLLAVCWQTDEPLADRRTDPQQLQAATSVTCGFNATALQTTYQNANQVGDATTFYSPAFTKQELCDHTQPQAAGTHPAAAAGSLRQIKQE
jgi:hypothetical protein